MKDLEAWKDIPEYEGVYQISNLGRVKSTARESTTNGVVRNLKERIMANQIDRGGYEGVNLFKDDKRVRHSVHRMVAENFVERPCTEKDVELEVNHIDGNKLNNHYTNLEWVTRLENIRHSIKIGLKRDVGVDSYWAKLTEREVVEIRELYKETKLTYEELAEEYDVGASTIGRIVRGEVYQNV